MEVNKHLNSIFSDVDNRLRCYTILVDIRGFEQMVTRDQDAHLVGSKVKKSSEALKRPWLDLDTIVHFWVNQFKFWRGAFLPPLDLEI